MSHPPHNIFIIDDDELLCFILKKQFEKYPEYKVWDTAANGREGLDLLKIASKEGRQWPEIILLDINMPVMNGWEFLEEVSPLQQKRDKSSCICILSSTINQEDQEKSTIFPQVKHFFTKPLLEEDIETLQRVCGN